MNLSLHDDVNCGGSNVYIELIEGEISCKTLPKVNFDRGTILSWTGNDLGTCLGKLFHYKKLSFNFKVRSTSGDDFCPKSLSISMDNGDAYEKTDMEDWVDKTKGGHTRIAPIISAKQVSGIDFTL